MAGIKEMLQGLFEVDGVRAVAIMGKDGFVAESLLRTDLDEEVFCGMLSKGTTAWDSVGEELSLGLIDRFIVEHRDGVVMGCTMDGSESFMVVMADTTANLGRLRHSLMRNAPEIAKAMGL